MVTLKMRDSLSSYLIFDWKICRRRDLSNGILLFTRVLVNLSDAELRSFWVRRDDAFPVADRRL
jgi:hypothetical protein